MHVGILKGNGIGPEITAATQRVLEATGISFEWEDIPIADEAVEKHGHPLPCETVRRLKAIKKAIKAPLIVDKLRGRISCAQEEDDGAEDKTYPSLNNAIRRELGLFVNPRPIRGFPAVSGRHESLDVVIMREVTEDVYAGLEHSIGDDVAAEAVKLTTRAAAARVARFSFAYAKKHGRKRVTCLHKANVLGLTDGLFLRCFREVAAEFEGVVEADDMMIDAACYAVVRDPRRFDVVVTANQYGDIFSDLAAGLAGSLGLAPGANIGGGESGDGDGDGGVAVFEACHGAAPDIAGLGVANPLALVLSGALLLDEAGRAREAEAVRGAVEDVIGRGVDGLTPDLGGSGTTESVTAAVATEVRRRLQLE